MIEELVEQIGPGMSRILKAYDRSIFELTPSFTVVMFPFEEVFISPNGSANGRMIGRITDRKKTTLDMTKEIPTAAIARLAELTGKSQRTISRELKEYQDAGMIRSEGAKRNGRWVVS